MGNENRFHSAAADKGKGVLDRVFIFSKIICQESYKTIDEKEKVC